MTSFDANVTVNGERLNFSFNRIYTLAREKYVVGVFKDHRLFQFDMMKKDGRNWTICEPAPGWAKEIEWQLSDNIHKNSP
ncbi:MAG TPA: hypothetical protein VGQ53_10245 [Chitinophagaceae bacterium]|jgi:hypothetical protein|nr:hypothetical protein [Chitinophagaceae bacterium]